MNSSVLKRIAALILCLIMVFSLGINVYSNEEPIVSPDDPIIYEDVQQPAAEIIMPAAAETPAELGTPEVPEIPAVETLPPVQTADLPPVVEPEPAEPPAPAKAPAEPLAPAEPPAEIPPAEPVPEPVDIIPEVPADTPVSDDYPAAPTDQVPVVDPIPTDNPDPEVAPDPSVIQDPTDDQLPVDGQTPSGEPAPAVDPAEVPATDPAEVPATDPAEVPVTDPAQVLDDSTIPSGGEADPSVVDPVITDPEAETPDIAVPAEPAPVVLQLSQELISYTGDIFNIEVISNDPAGFPAGAVLAASELIPETPLFATYFDAAAAFLQMDDIDKSLISMIRFFDIAIWADGVKYQPLVPVTIKITTVKPKERIEGDIFTAIHFADAGPYVVPDVVAKPDLTEISYLQNYFPLGEFSVTAFLLKAPRIIFDEEIEEDNEEINEEDIISDDQQDQSGEEQTEEKNTEDENEESVSDDENKIEDDSNEDKLKEAGKEEKEDEDKNKEKDDKDKKEDGEDQEEEDKDKDETEDAEDEKEETEEERTRRDYVYEDEFVSVTATLSDAQAVPDDAELKVTPVYQESSDYNYDAYMDALNSSDLEKEYTSENTLLYDISFMAHVRDEDGNLTEELYEYEPEAGTVSVNVVFKQEQLKNEINAEDDQVEVIHLAADTEADTATISAGEITAEPVEADVSVDGAEENVQFVTESFSVYAFSYTVDFYWEVDGEIFEFSLAGGDSISFHELVEHLHILDGNAQEESVDVTASEEDDLRIDKFIKDIEDIKFSTPELLWAGKVLRNMTAKEIAEENALQVEYSQRLTEEQIAEMQAKSYVENDWVLLSLKPFTSEEYLTVRLSTGEEFQILVKDALENSVTLHFVMEDGTPISGVTYNNQSGENYYIDGSTFEITEEWLRTYIGNQGTLDLTKFIPSNGFTFSNTHKSTYEDLEATPYPHTIIGNELTWIGEKIQYRLFYTNSDLAGWYWFDAGTEPKRDDDHWKYYDDTFNPYDRGKIDTEGDNNPSPFDYYLVYSPDARPGAGSGTEGQRYSPANLDGKFQKSKTLTPNDDGTYTMDLSVTTSALPHDEDNKVNIIILFDTSSSMNRDIYNPKTRYNNPTDRYKTEENSRFYQAVQALNTFVHNICSNNSITPNAVQLALVDFNEQAYFHTFDGGGYWTTSADEFMNHINALTIKQGTNWAQALASANTIMSSSDKDPTYVLLMTDGAPSQYWAPGSVSGYFVGGEGCYLGALDEARGVVNDDMELYGIFSFGTTEDANNGYLTKLVNYAYEKEMPTHSYYAQSTEVLINDLSSIFAVISEKIGHTNVNYHDGIALDTTSTALNVNVGGNLGSITYSKTGGITPAYKVVADSSGNATFTVGGTQYPGSLATVQYSKATGSSDTGGITVVDASAQVYQCTVGSGSNAVTYNMPIATLNINETTKVGDLNWDLSPLGLLEDGATYSISFVVWPDQEAYNYVADLNNGKKTWDTSKQEPVYAIDTATGQQTQTVLYYKKGVEAYPNIVFYPNQNKYAVLTNTEQEVKYYIVDERGNISTYYGQYSTTPPYPDPMPLESAKSRVEKQWNVERDPGIMAQLLYDDEEHPLTIPFKILQDDEEYKTVNLGWDGQKYVWEADSEQKVSYKDQERTIGTLWANAFSIATGLMLSETKMEERGLDKNAYPSGLFKGTRYYMLEEGHDYKIDEDLNLGYQFDFLSPVYHPMLVDGKLQSATFSIDETATSNVNKLTITEMTNSADGLSGLRVENTLRGYINLEKIIQEEPGYPIPDDDKKFEFTITLSNNKGPFVETHIPWYGINRLFYHDADFNYYQAEPTTAGHLSLKTESGETYDATCQGTFNPDIVGPTAVTYNDGTGTKNIQLYGNQMNSADPKNASATLKITQGQILNIANVPVGTTYTITETSKNGFVLVNTKKEIKNGNVVESSDDGDTDGTVSGTIVTNRDNHITFTNKNLSVMKKETAPYDGTGTLGAVNVGDTITYQIKCKNYQSAAATIMIKDTLDANVEFVSCSESGSNSNGVVTWTFDNVAPGTEKTVTVTVKVKDTALNTGKVVNGGNGTTVKVGDDNEIITKPVENPVVDKPEKKETEPYDGTGTLGAVGVGDTITYEISGKNYQSSAATMVIKDTLDTNVEYISCSEEGTHEDGVVTWTFENVAAEDTKTVTLTVRVKDTALSTGKVVNGGNETTVKVGSDKEMSTESVENPVVDKPEKKETAPYVGTGTRGAVNVGDTITYTISGKNYQSAVATMVIKDTLDENVEFVSCSDPGSHTDGVVTWNFDSVDPGETKTVTLTVKVKDNAPTPVTLVNGGDGTTVKVGTDKEMKTDPVENPAVNIVRDITGIAWFDKNQNGVREAEDTVLKEIEVKLFKKDVNENYDLLVAETTTSSTDGSYTFTNLPDGDYKVVFYNPQDVTEKNKAEAGKNSIADIETDEDGNPISAFIKDIKLPTNQQIIEEINAGTLPDGHYVKEYQDVGFIANEPIAPHKKETSPDKGTGTRQAVMAGDLITYSIEYTNYKTYAAKVVIKDVLDPNVKLVSAGTEGTYTYDTNTRTVTWTLTGVTAGAEGSVTLQVKVLESALKSKDGPGKVVNGGNGTNRATVQIGNDQPVPLEEVTNPVLDISRTIEGTAWFDEDQDGIREDGDGPLANKPVELYKKNEDGEYVKVEGKDTVTDANGHYTFENLEPGDYQVVIVNPQDSTIKDDEPNGKNSIAEGLKDSDGHPTGSVITGIELPDDAKIVELYNKQDPSVKDGTYIKDKQDGGFIANDPVAPHKKETAPGDGTGTLQAVKAGDLITYTIEYTNYQTYDAKVVIKDVLDPNVELVSASAEGTYEYDKAARTVTWTIPGVLKGTSGSVTLQVKVLESALKSQNGPGQVVNGGDGANGATVKIGNAQPVPLEEVTNPVLDISRTIEGTAWFDEDQDGIREDDDEPLKNVPVELYKKNKDGVYEKVEGKDIVTDANGYYTFEDLEPGDYQVVFVNPQDSTKQSDKPDGKNSIAEGQKDTDGHPTGSVIKDITLPDDKEIVDLYNNHDPSVKDGTYVKDKQDGGFIANDLVAPHKKETAPGQGTGTLQAVKVGDLITYTIEYTNYQTYDAKVVIKDVLDKNVKLVNAGKKGTYEYNSAGRTVTWTISGVKAGATGSVTLQVEVLESALKSQKGPGQVVNGGNGANGATVQIGNDPAVPLEEVTNPVLDISRTIEGTAWFDKDQDGIREDTDELLKNVPVELYKKNKDGVYEKVKGKDTVTDENGYYTFEDLEPGDYQVVIVNPQDVTKKSDEPDGKNSIAGGQKDAAGNPTGAVITSIRLPGDDEVVKLYNDKDPSVKDGTYVKDKMDGGFISNSPEAPSKQEVGPYKGNGTLGAVNVGDTITYEISFTNYKTYEANVVIQDVLDPNVELVENSVRINSSRVRTSARPKDAYIYDEKTHTLTWTLWVAPGKPGTVRFSVKVKDGALASKDGPGKVVNGGDSATVKVGNDKVVSLDKVENPVILINRTIEGLAWLDNNQDGARDDTDELLENTPVELYRMTPDGSYEKVASTTTDQNGRYSFTNLPDGDYQVVFVNPKNVTKKSDVPDGKNSIAVGQKNKDGSPASGIITNIKLPTNAEIVRMVNSGKQEGGSYVKDKQDGGFIEEIPVKPVKKETAPFTGTGVLGAVNVGDVITYEISYKNYTSTKDDVVIKDTLDANVEFVSASHKGKFEKGVVTWTIKNVPPAASGKVTISVKVLPSALVSQKGPGKVVNGGSTSTVQFGNGPALSLNEVENPVAKLSRAIEGTAWIDQDKDGVRGENDRLLANVKIKLYRKNSDGTYEFVKSTVTDKNGLYKFDDLDGGTYQVVFDRAQTTTTKSDTADGKHSIVEEQLDENGKPIGAVISDIVLPTDEEILEMIASGEITNGAYVMKNQDGGFVANTPKAPHKSEIAPFKGDGTLGSVKVGDQITYEISYQNYMTSAADVVISDTLDKNVEFVKASDNGQLKDGVVTWNLKDIPAGQEGTVTLTVKVLEGALSSKQGPGKVVNGGETATVTVGNGTAYKLNTVQNPVTAASSSSSSTSSSGSPSSSSTRSNPRTGDDSPMLYIYLGVSLAALIAFIILGVGMIRKRKNEKR